MSSIEQQERDDGRAFDVIVVGAGFAGMYLLHRARAMGLDRAGLRGGHRCRRHVVLESLPGRAL